jgi:tetratricopeptide (TPR) repeat protein
VLCQIEKISEALIGINNAIASKPGAADGECFAVRGTIYYLQKNYDKAVADFSQAIAKAPQIRSVAYYSRARTYYLMGKLSDAQADLEKLTALNAQDFDSCFFLALSTCNKNNIKK